MTTENFCFYLQNRLVQTSQTGGQQYRDTSPFTLVMLYILGITFFIKQCTALTTYNCITIDCINLHCNVHCVLHCITLHYIALHCITLHYIALHCITLHYIALHYASASHCITLYMFYCIVRSHHIILHCIVLYATIALL
jgi:hypothetical protein